MTLCCSFRSQAKANSHRRAREFVAAQADLSEALKLFPRFLVALHDQALLQMDQGLPTDALHSLQQVRPFPVSLGFPLNALYSVFVPPDSHSTFV